MRRTLSGLLSREDFAEAEVKAIRIGGGIVKGDLGGAPEGRAIGHLDPKSGIGGSEVLVDQELARGGGSGDGAVIIVADGEDQGIIAGGDQRGAGQTDRSVRGADGADGARAVGPGGVHALKAHDRDRRGGAGRKSGCDIDVAERGGGKGSPDFGGSTLGIGPDHQGPL